MVPSAMTRGDIAERPRPAARSAATRQCLAASNHIQRVDVPPCLHGRIRSFFRKTMDMPLDLAIIRAGGSGRSGQICVPRTTFDYSIILPFGVYIGLFSVPAPPFRLAADGGVFSLFTDRTRQGVCTCGRSIGRRPNGNPIGCESTIDLTCPDVRFSTDRDRKGRTFRKHASPPGLGAESRPSRHGSA